MTTSKTNKTQKPDVKEMCNCRGNLNANSPELPCSSCGGVNPNRKTKPPKEREK